MHEIEPFLLFCQTLGALGGAFSAVAAEIAYVRALRDGHIDKAERRHLELLTHGLRYGMLLLLLASIGTVVYAYVYHAPTQPALSTSYWIFMVLALIVIILTWATGRKVISFSVGSAGLFAGWWCMAYLAMGLFPQLSLVSSLFAYLILAGVFLGLLHYARFLTIKFT